MAAEVVLTDDRHLTDARVSAGGAAQEDGISGRRETSPNLYFFTFFADNWREAGGADLLWRFL
jgi:hypothetical protein